MTSSAQTVMCVRSPRGRCVFWVLLAIAAATAAEFLPNDRAIAFCIAWHASVVEVAPLLHDGYTCSAAQWHCKEITGS